MATRLYLTAATAPVTPASGTYTGGTTEGWDGPAAPGPTTNKLARSGVWPGATTFTNAAQTKGNTTANTDHCNRKFVSDPLIGAQSIVNTGTLRGQASFLESAATANAHTQIIAKVVSNDGATLRGVLYSGDSRTGTVDEMTTANRNQNVPAATIDPVTISNTVSALDGDRILVEIGFRANSTTSTHGTTLRFGSTATPGGANDLAVDGTETTDLNGWVEFSQNLNFEYTTDVRVSFPTPTTSPGTGAGLQEFRALVRKKVNDSNQPLARIELWENGALVSTPLADTAVNSTTGTVLLGTWDASSLTTASGANVECKVVGTGVGLNNLEVGAIEWNKLPEDLEVIDEPAPLTYTPQPFIYY